MKKSSKILLITSLILLGGLGVVGGVTYAGYARGEDVGQSAKTKRYLFLDATRVLDEQNRTWENDGAKFYVYAWTEGAFSETGGHWFPSMGKQGNYHFFYVPTLYVRCIFVRMSSTAQMGLWDYENEVTWGQTSDLTVSTNNLYTITAWHTSVDTPEDPAQGIWSLFASNA